MVINLFLRLIGLRGFIGVIGLSLLSSCHSEKVNQKAAARAVSVQSAMIPLMKDFLLEHYEGAQKIYSLEAKEAIVKQEEDKVYIAAPKLGIYRAGSDNLSVEASSGKGLVLIKNEDLVLEDNVVYKVIPRNAVLTTQRLIYWAKRRETEVPEGVGYVLKSPDGVIEGSGMVSNEELTK